MKKGETRVSSSQVIMMCGPAGSGKSTVARRLQQEGMTLLSYDQESFQRGWKTHPLPKEVLEDIKSELDGRLIELIEKNRDVVLDYSFWSRQSRREYISLLGSYGIVPVIYYVTTPKDVIMERMQKRRGDHENDIILSQEMASFYYDHFEPPTDEEGQIVVIEGSESGTAGEP